MEEKEANLNCLRLAVRPMPADYSWVPGARDGSRQTLPENILWQRMITGARRFLG